ncbi:MAG TPA: lamin tail domain-containing protein [Thermoleophilaceae bacterium]
MRSAALGVAICATLVSLLATSGSARAASKIFQVPCMPGQAQPVCFAEDARLDYVDDGDTIDVDIPGAGNHRIRFTGVNATEQSVYNNDLAKQQGECHALNATYLTTSMIRRSNDQVRLVYQNKLTRAGVRFVKDIQVFVRGSWHDLNALLISRGDALFLPNGLETAWNREYMFLMQQAAHRGVGLFDTSFCGYGPDQDIPIQLTVHPNAAGDDTINVNGEYVRIFNGGTRPLDLSGWWVRNGGTRRYHFAAGTVVQPNTRITVHVGKGRSTATIFYWGRPSPLFPNENDSKGIGDGAYLFDPQGDLRAWIFYPCRLAPCANPLPAGT